MTTSLRLQLFWLQNKRLVTLLGVLAMVIALTVGSGFFFVSHASAKALVADKTALSANDTNDCTPTPSSGPTEDDCVVNVTYSGSSTTLLKLVVTTSSSLSGVSISANPDSVSKTATTSAVTVKVPFQDTSIPPHDNCQAGIITISDGTDTANIAWSCKHELTLVPGSSVLFHVVSDCPSDASGNTICNVNLINSSSADITLSSNSATPSDGITFPSTAPVAHPKQVMQYPLQVDLSTCTSNNVVVTIGDQPNQVSVTLDCTNKSDIVIPSTINCTTSCVLTIISKGSMETWVATSTIPGVAFLPNSGNPAVGVGTVSSLSPASLTIEMPFCVQGIITISTQTGHSTVLVSCKQVAACDSVSQLATTLKLNAADTAAFTATGGATQDSSGCTTTFVGKIASITCPTTALSLTFTAEWMSPKEIGAIQNCKPGIKIKQLNSLTVYETGTTPTLWGISDVCTAVNSLYGSFLHNDQSVIIFNQDGTGSCSGQHGSSIKFKPYTDLNRQDP